MIEHNARPDAGQDASDQIDSPRRLRATGTRKESAEKGR